MNKIAPTSINYKRYEFRSTEESRSSFFAIADIYDNLGGVLLSSTGYIVQERYDQFEGHIQLVTLTRILNEEYTSYTWLVGQYINN